MRDPPVLIPTPSGGGGTEIFLKGANVEWNPVPELKTSVAWGILFFISGTNESVGKRKRRRQC